MRGDGIPDPDPETVLDAVARARHYHDASHELGVSRDKLTRLLAKIQRETGRTAFPQVVVEGKRSPLGKPRMTDEAFQAVWNSAGCMRDVCDHFGMKRETVLGRARGLRWQGVRIRELEDEWF